MSPAYSRICEIDEGQSDPVTEPGVAEANPMGYVRAEMPEQQAQRRDPPEGEQEQTKDNDRAEDPEDDQARPRAHPFQADQNGRMANRFRLHIVELMYRSSL